VLAGLLLLHTLLVPTVAMTQLKVSQGLFIKVQIIISMYPLPGTVSKEGVGWPLVLPIAAALGLLQQSCASAPTY
jgi:hypothetical protein